MHPKALEVLNALRKNKRLGVTVEDFTLGFRLAARIFDLREAGYVIHSEPGRVARYILLKEPKQTKG